MQRMDGKWKQESETTPWSSISALSFWFLVLLLSVASVSRADYEASYSKGVEAIQKEEWGEAIQWLQQAIEERSEAGGRVSAAGKRQRYIPYHHLGFALYHTGALREASAAWRESAIQGKVKPKMRKEVEELLFKIEEIAGEKAAVEESSLPEWEIMLSPEELANQQRGVERQLARAGRKASALETPRMQEALAADAALIARFDESLRRLNKAREIYEMEGMKDNPVALTEVHALATEAAAALEKLVFKAFQLEREAKKPIFGQLPESSEPTAEELPESSEPTVGELSESSEPTAEELPESSMSTSEQITEPSALTSEQISKPSEKILEPTPELEEPDADEQG